VTESGKAILNNDVFNIIIIYVHCKQQFYSVRQQQAVLSG